MNQGRIIVITGAPGTGKMVELVGTSIPIGVTESGVSTFDVLA